MYLEEIHEVGNPRTSGSWWGLGQRPNRPLNRPHRLLRRVIHHQLAQRNRQNALHNDDRSGNNAGVVPACNRQLCVFPSANVYRLLLLRDGRRRLHGDAEYDGHAVCDTARHTAVMVARADDLSVPHAHRVVCLTAAHARQQPAVAKLNRLDRRNGKRQLADDTLHRTEDL